MAIAFVTSRWEMSPLCLPRLTLGIAAVVSVTSHWETGSVASVTSQIGDCG